MHAKKLRGLLYLYFLYVEIVRKSSFHNGCKTKGFNLQELKLRAINACYFLESEENVCKKE